MPYAERLQVRWDRTISGYTEDMIVATMHFSTPSDGPLGNTVRAAVEARFGTFWGVWKTFCHGNYGLVEYRWYQQNVYPTPSPNLRTTAITSVPGTGTGNFLPAQVSISCTLQTLYRRRWGRFYMPGWAHTYFMGLSGRLNVTNVDTVATALQTFIQGSKTDGAVPVVWSPRGGVGPPAFVAGEYLPVTGVRVDDVPDIIRSRRLQGAPYRKILPIT